MGSTIQDVKITLKQEFQIRNKIFEVTLVTHFWDKGHNDDTKYFVLATVRGADDSHVDKQEIASFRGL